MSRKRKNKGLVHSGGAKREEASFESGSMEVQGLDSPSPVSSGPKTPAPCFESNRTRPGEHRLPMEKQSKPQRRVWSDERSSCCACCFPWACRLRVLLILRLLHFLLHLPAPISLAAGLSPQSVQRGAPDKQGLGFFPAVPEAHRVAMAAAAATELSSIRHYSINTSLPHQHTERETGRGCCCTSTP